MRCGEHQDHHSRCHGNWREDSGEVSPLRETRSGHRIWLLGVAPATTPPASLRLVGVALGVVWMEETSW